MSLAGTPMQLSSPPKVGRHFVLGFEGTRLPEELKSFAARYGLGGVVLFSKNCPDAATVKDLCAEVHDELRDPDDGWTPLVLIDQEGGRVERIRDGEGVPHLPSAAELALMGEEVVTQRVFEQSAALRGLGIDVNLAPVCDVVRPGESGVIGDRSFAGAGKGGSAYADNGGYGETAARYAAAFHRGMVRAGVIGCAKHFPGHGASSFDTHTHSGVVELSAEELDATDLIPFRALVAEGVGLVMAAHLTLPKVDDEPVFLSRHWLDTVLRSELGFDGVIISDDMEMAAARNEGDPQDVALQALFAGCDLLIYGRNLPSSASLDPSKVAAALEQAIPDHLMEASTRRLWSLRK